MAENVCERYARFLVLPPLRMQSLAYGEMSEMIILAKLVCDKHIEILEFLLLHIRWSMVRHVCELIR